MAHITHCLCEPFRQLIAENFCNEVRKKNTFFFSFWAYIYDFDGKFEKKNFRILIKIDVGGYIEFDQNLKFFFFEFYFKIINVLTFHEI